MKYAVSFATVLSCALMLAVAPATDAFAAKKKAATNSADLRQTCITKVRTMYPDAQNVGTMASDKREQLVRNCIRSGGRVI